jgi:hypothetical protein
MKSIAIAIIVVVGFGFVPAYNAMPDAAQKVAAALTNWIR